MHVSIELSYRVHYRVVNRVHYEMTKTTFDLRMRNIKMI